MQFEAARMESERSRFAGQLIRAVIVCTIALLDAGCFAANSQPHAQKQGVKMATGLELTWVEVGSIWIPSRPFPMRLRLTSSLKKPTTTQLLEGPNPALGFAVFRKGEAPQWHAGAEASDLAGLRGNQGMIANGVLAPGQSWETCADLNHYWLPPMPGRYRLAAHYMAADGIVEAPIQDIELAPARLTAAGSILESASELLLANAWGDAAQLWLRLASGGYPLAPRWLLNAGKWPGKGKLRIAQHAFSPLADPPIPAYRFWIVWEDEGRLGGTLLDHQGIELARFQESNPSAKGCELLTPIQKEDGELCLPIVAGAGQTLNLKWLRVPASGGTPAPWAIWKLPPGARPTVTAASPAGIVAVMGIDASQKRVFGSWGPLRQKAQTPQELLYLEHGKIVYLSIVDLRNSIHFLAVRLMEEKSGRHVTIHSRGGNAVMDSGPISIPDKIAPVDFRTIWLSRSGPVLVMRDSTSKLWLVPGMAGATWKAVPGIQATTDFGITGMGDSAIVWAADAELGLRFAPASMF